MLTLDVSDFRRMAEKFGAASRNMPRVLSKAMNDAVKETRPVLVHAWHSGVTVRNGPFLGWALRTKFASTGSLRVEINDERAKGRAHLKKHDQGGTKNAEGRALAIPVAGSAPA